MANAKDSLVSRMEAACPMADMLPVLPGDNESPLAGRALFDADSCQYADVVRAGDLISADFGVKDVHSCGGLYLVEAVEEGRVVWRGCRQMMRVTAGIAIDQNGRGEWVTLPSLDAAGWRIAGRVENVYRKQ